MFGFSLAKLLFTILIVLGVFWWMKKMTSKAARGEDDISDDSEKTIEDMEPCPVCGSFFVSGLDRNCGCNTTK
jgi:formate dehydrogenase maturation protein FdhE